MLERNETSSHRMRGSAIYPAIVFTVWTAWVTRTYIPKSIPPLRELWGGLFPRHMSFLAALLRCLQQPWARDLGMVLVLALAAICAGGWILDRLRISIPQVS